MEFQYTVIGFEPQAGSVVVWVRNSVHPTGEKMMIPALNSDGTWKTQDEIRAIIESAIPVGRFETIKAQFEKNDSFDHIVALQGKEYVVEKRPQDQGVYKPAAGTLKADIVE